MLKYQERKPINVIPPNTQLKVSINIVELLETSIDTLLRMGISFVELLKPANNTPLRMSISIVELLDQTKQTLFLHLFQTTLFLSVCINNPLTEFCPFVSVVV
jgi:hypothetical protein